MALANNGHLGPAAFFDGNMAYRVEDSARRNHSDSRVLPGDKAL